MHSQLIIVLNLKTCENVTLTQKCRVNLIECLWIGCLSLKLVKLVHHPVHFCIYMNKGIHHYLAHPIDFTCKIAFFFITLSAKKMVSLAIFFGGGAMNLCTLISKNQVFPYIYIFWYIVSKNMRILHCRDNSYSPSLCCMLKRYWNV